MSERSRTEGFTLIELMTVVAIIGILAAIALPQYQNYVAKAQIAEAPTLIDGMKSAMAEAISSDGDGGCVVPASMPVTGKYVSTIAVAGTAAACVVTATYAASSNAQVAGKTIGYTYSASAGTWTCSTTLPAGLRPPGC